MGLFRDIFGNPDESECFQKIKSELLKKIVHYSVVSIMLIIIILSIGAFFTFIGWVLWLVISLFYPIAETYAFLEVWIGSSLIVPIIYFICTRKSSKN